MFEGSSWKAEGQDGKDRSTMPGVLRYCFIERKLTNRTGLKSLITLSMPAILIYQASALACVDKVAIQVRED